MKKRFLFLASALMLCILLSGCRPESDEVLEPAEIIDVSYTDSAF